MRIKRELAFLVAIMMVISLMPGFAFADSEKGEANPQKENEAPTVITRNEITISDFFVSKHETDLNEEVTVRFHVKVETDDPEALLNGYASEMMSTRGDFASETCPIESPGIDEHQKESDVVFTASFPSYGHWGMASITIGLTDGTNVVFRDERFRELNPLLDDEFAVDLSAFDVLVATDTVDTIPPFIDAEALTISASEIEYGEEIRIGIKAADNADIRSIGYYYYTDDKPDCGFGITWSVNGGYYGPDEQGLYWLPVVDYLDGDVLYQLEYIELYDVFYNRTCIYNSQWLSRWGDSYEPDDATADPVDMSAADFRVGPRPNSDDVTPPVIDPQSIQIDTKRVAFNEEENAIRVKIEDESEMEHVFLTLLIRCRVPQVTSQEAEYDPEQKCYVFHLDQYYHTFLGEYTIQSIDARDKAGNQAVIADPNACRKRKDNADWYDPWVTDFVDLSGYSYLCGLKDKDADTDTFAYGDGIVNPDNAELNATLVDENADNHESLMEEFVQAGYDSDGYEDASLYEVDMDMDGDIPEDDYVKVLLPAEKEEGFQEGDIVRISHLTSDGSIQTRYSRVKNESALIGVNEFSPFIVEKADEETAVEISKDLIDPEPMTFVPSDNTNVDRHWDGQNTISFVEGDAIRIYDEIKEDYIIYQYENSDSGDGFYYNNKKLNDEIRTYVDDERTCLVEGDRLSAEVLCNGLPIATQGDFTFKLIANEENWDRFKYCWIDDICYCVENISDTEAKVIGYGGDPDPEEGKSAVIRKQVMINGKEYSVTSIEVEALAFSGLVEVTIPSTVQQIGEHALGFDMSYETEEPTYIKIDGFTIKGLKGSVAEEYAVENGFIFVDHQEEAKHTYDYDEGECVVCGSKMNGWHQLNNTWYYYKNGKKTKGWQLINGSWYYLDSNGAMKTGWQKDSGGWCYLLGSGKAAKSQWVYWSGDWYYIKADMHMAANQWQKDSGGWCYLLGNGKTAKSQWIYWSGDWYYIKADMHMAANQWQKDSNGWCYLLGSGKAAKSQWIYWSGKWYYLKSNCIMATGWQKDAGKWYYLNSSGAMVTGWQKIGGTWYYFNGSGAMVTGTVTIGGKRYRFSSSGAWVG